VTASSPRDLPHRYEGETQHGPTASPQNSITRIGRPNRHTESHHTASAERSHTFVTTMLDAGVDLRDVQIAARHADPRTTKRYDRARQNLDRHPNYILAAFMASGT
jgi:site-specific recombinase XerD